MGIFSFFFKKDSGKIHDDIIDEPLQQEVPLMHEYKKLDIPWIGNFKDYDEYCEEYRKYLESGPMSVKVEIEGVNFKRYRKDGTFWYESLPPRPSIDKREPFCPNCGGFLTKIPERAKKCEHCGKKIYTFSFNGVKILRTEEVGEEKYRIEHERNERFQEYVNSGEYLSDRLDELKSSGANIAIISGGGCEKCSGDRKMSIISAYNISPTCTYCGYGYTVTGRIDI